MKEVFLINPPFSFVYGFKKDISSILPPMGLLSIAGSLKEHNNKVRFYDLEFIEDYDLLFKNIEKASIIGITLTTTAFIHASNIAKKIKSLNPNCIIIGGGWHVNKDTWDTILDYEFDILIFGEGEKIFSKLIEFYKNSNNPTTNYLIKHANKEIKYGIAVKSQSKKIVYEGYNIIDNIDELPIPAYDMVDWNRYKPSAHRDLGYPFLPIITARGCPFSCRYCANTGNWRLHSVNYIFELLLKAGKKFNKKIENLVIWDDTFTHPKKRMSQMLKMLSDFRLNFSINSHPNAIDEKIMYQLKRSGCKIIFFGIESDDKKILKGLGRKTTIDDLKSAVKLASHNNILSSGSVMIGTPFDTVKTIKSNVKFLKETINPDLCFFSPFSIEPGTVLYKELVNKKEIPEYKVWYTLYSNNNEFTNIPPAYIPSSNKNLNKSEIDRYVKWAYNTFYNDVKINELKFKTTDLPFLNNIIERLVNRRQN